MLVFFHSFLSQYFTVYTSMLNFVKIAKQLDQGAVPIFCYKGVFRILADIYLQRKDEFQILIKMLGGFYASTFVKHSIDKYIQISEIKGSHQQTKVFGVNVVDTVISGINYKQSFKGCLIIADPVENWDVFLKINDIIKLMD